MVFLLAFLVRLETILCQVTRNKNEGPKGQVSYLTGNDYDYLFAANMDESSSGHGYT